MASVALREPLLERVSWGALFAGFFFGFGVWMVLLALGAGIGLAAFDPRDVGHWQGLGIGFGIWGVISGVVAMFVAGWLSARLSATDARLSGMLHGAALWGFMVVAGLWIAAMAVAGTASTAASAAGSAAEAAGAAAQGAPAEMQQMQQRAEQQMQQMRQEGGEAAAAAKTAGTAGAWAFFVYGILTLGAAILGGRAGVSRVRRVVQEERIPPPGAPLPQRA